MHVRFLLRRNYKRTETSSLTQAWRVRSLSFCILRIVTCEAGYGNRTRLLGLGSRCTTDVLIPPACDDLSPKQPLQLYYHLIIFASIELGKAIISSDDKAIKTAISSLIKKAIAGVIIFFIPTIVNVIVSMVDAAGDYEKAYSACTKCMEKPGNCKPEEASNSDLYKPVAE